jgi:hypothetical protein
VSVVYFNEESEKGNNRLHSDNPVDLTASDILSNSSMQQIPLSDNTSAPLIETKGEIL